MVADDLTTSTVLRLISLEEIKSLCSVSEGAYRLSLTSLMEKRIDHRVKHKVKSKEEVKQLSKAKIIPIQEEAVEEKTTVQMKQAAGAEFSETQESSEGKKTTMKIVGKETVFYDPEEEKPKEEAIDMTDFILSEKKKAEKNQRVLKEKEVMSLYRKNASVEIKHNKEAKEEILKSSYQGVLINKRQS